MLNDFRNRLKHVKVSACVLIIILDVLAKKNYTDYVKKRILAAIFF